MRVAADPTVRQDAPGAGPAPRLGALLGANVLYVFCLNVPEIAVPLVLVEQLHASPTWAAAVFVANTVLVVTLQVPVTTWSARWSRGTVMAASGVVLALGYLGFLFATGLGPAAVALVSVPFTLGEILYAGSSTALVTALAPPAPAGPRAGPLPTLHRLRPGRLPRRDHRPGGPRPRRPLGHPGRRHGRSLGRRLARTPPRVAA
ncbi:hypothetical protein GCM10020229_81110 [Kitasatospora albolonga]